MFGTLQQNIDIFIIAIKSKDVEEVTAAAEFVLDAMTYVNNDRYILCRNDIRIQNKIASLYNIDTPNDAKMVMDILTAIVVSGVVGAAKRYAQFPDAPITCAQFVQNKINNLYDACVRMELL